MDTFETPLRQERLYDGKIIRLRRDVARLPNGGEALREVVEHPGGVSILALDAQDNVLLVRQYRYAQQQELLELPAGKREYGEDPRACGIRELEEETGYVAGRFQLLATVLPTPAYCTEVIYVYLATQLQATAQRLDADEFLSVERVPFAKAVDMVLSGELTDAKTQVGILKYAALRAAGREGELHG